MRNARSHLPVAGERGIHPVEGGRGGTVVAELRLVSGRLKEVEGCLEVERGE